MVKEKKKENRPPSQRKFKKQENLVVEKMGIPESASGFLTDFVPRKDDLMKRKMNLSPLRKASVRVKDLQTFGDPDNWKLICKASSEEEGWMRSTKAMPLSAKRGVRSACLVQVSSMQRNPDGSYALAEAIAFIPDGVVSSVGNGCCEVVLTDGTRQR